MFSISEHSAGIAWLPPVRPVAVEARRRWRRTSDPGVLAVAVVVRPSGAVAVRPDPA
jgi:hypothetical protein